jgi:hypothetical protein
MAGVDMRNGLRALVFRSCSSEESLRMGIESLILDSVACSEEGDSKDSEAKEEAILA